MIKTEAKRHIIETIITPPKSVRNALTRMDDKLELFFNLDDNQWEIYRLKTRGAIPSEDVLCWQMSAPNKGTLITDGIADWLKKYNKNPMLSKSKEELNKEWLNAYKNARSKIIKEDRQKGLELERENDNVGYWFGVQHKQITVPITVGFNKKTGKPIRMAKLGAKRIPRKSIAS